MRNVVAWGVLAAGLYVLQTSLLPLLAYHGISANLLLLLTVSFALLRGHQYGVLMGFFAGLMQDLATGTFFGVGILSFMLIGWCSGRMSSRVFKEPFLLPVLASAFAASANYFIWVLLTFLMGYSFQMPEHMQYTLLPMVIYQMLFAYPVHKMAYDLERWLRYTD